LGCLSQARFPDCEPGSKHVFCAWHHYTFLCLVQSHQSVPGTLLNVGLLTKKLNLSLWSGSAF
jgi:hypothetical protein